MGALERVETPQVFTSPPIHTPDAHRCPTCGFGGSDWQEWSNLQRRPFKIKVTRPDGREIFMNAQQAKVMTILSLAAERGLTKRQLSGWHVGHWVQQIREEGIEVNMTMQKAVYNKTRYGLYTLLSPVKIEHLPNPPKAKKNRGKS